MKRLLILSVFTFAFTFGTLAQDKSSDSQKLIGLMNSEKMIEEMMNSMIPIYKQQAREQFRGEETNEKFAEFMEVLTKETKDFSHKLIDEVMVELYEKHFTHEELKDLIKFYESPTGEKLIKVTPDITKDMMNIMMSEYLPEFQEKLMNKLGEF